MSFQVCLSNTRFNVRSVQLTLQHANPLGLYFLTWIWNLFNLFSLNYRKLKIYEEQELTMKIFAEPSEFQIPADNSSLRQHNSITQNLLGMETPPAPLLIDSFGGFGSSDAGGDLDNNYATIQPINYSSSSNNNNSSLADNSRSTNNTINLIDADYQTLRTSPRAAPVSDLSLLHTWQWAILVVRFHNQ